MSNDIDVYEVLDSLLESGTKLLEQIDSDQLNALVEQAPKLMKLVSLLEKIDDETIESLEKLLGLLPLLGKLANNLGPCMEQAIESMNTAEPIAGLRGLLKTLRDKDVQEGLGKIMAVVKAVGKCKF